MKKSAILCILALLIGDVLVGNEVTVEFEDVAKGGFATDYEVESGSHIEVIRDETTWKRVWSEVPKNENPDSKPPKVDFSVENVVIAFSEMKGSNGIPIEIKEIVLDSTNDWNPIKVEVNTTFYYSVLRPFIVARRFHIVKYKIPQ